MDAICALHPEDQFEADIAVRIVTMHAHAMDALRSASLADGDPNEVRRCRAQAASMARSRILRSALCGVCRPSATRRSTRCIL